MQVTFKDFILFAESPRQPRKLEPLLIKRLVQVLNFLFSFDPILIKQGRVFVKLFNLFFRFLGDRPFFSQGVFAPFPDQFFLPSPCLPVGNHRSYFPRFALEQEKAIKR